MLVLELDELTSLVLCLHGHWDHRDARFELADHRQRSFPILLSDDRLAVGSPDSDGHCQVLWGDGLV